MTTTGPKNRLKPLLRIAQHSTTLQFSARTVQSRMDGRRPDALSLDYTRLMMGFLLLQPSPADIAMIGLGGGSLAKFCHRHLAANIRVAEINAEVIALRETFQVPPDSARFSIVEADGADFVRSQRNAFDVLLVDGYDESGLPASLSSAAFYARCARLLREGGVLAANLNLDPQRCARQVELIRRQFGAAAFVVRGTGSINRVVFAENGARTAPLAGRLRKPDGIAKDAQRELRHAFARVARAAREMTV